MSLPPTRRSSTWAYQALVWGIVLDSLTASPPRTLPVVRLVDRDAGREYPLEGQVLSDGSFAFYGSPERAFPLLDQQTYRLRVEASATGYNSGSFEFDAGPALDQPAPATRTVPLETIPVDFHHRKRRL